MKRFLLAGCSAIALLLTTAAPAHAAVLAAPLVAAAGITGLAGTVATGLIGGAITLGASFALQTLFPQKRPPGGAELQVQTGGAQSRKVAFGHVADAGHLVYWNSYGKKNRFLQRAFRLCDWECESLEAVWINGERKTLTSVTVTGNENARYEVDGFGDKFIVRWFAGASDQLADTDLVTNSNPTGRWTANHRLRGVCYVSITCRYDEKLFADVDLNNLRWEYKGAKVYDRRKDSTAGGSGTHRHNDPSTWEYSDNPFVCADTFLQGMYRNGVLVHGWGLPPLAISGAHIVAGANLCDEVLTEGGASVKRYTVSAITSQGNELREALAAFVNAAGGYYYEGAGVVYLVAGGSQTAVATLSSADLVRDAKYKYRERAGRAQMVNRVSGTFTDPASGWEQADYPEVTDAGWVSEDSGEDLPFDLSLPSVRSGYQAERIALIRANSTRLSATLTIEVSEKWISVSAGDWINYSDSKVGAGRVWLVEGVTEQPERGTLILSLRETSAAVFSDSVVYTPGAAAAPDLDAGITTVQNLQVQAITKEGTGGQKRPALKVTWDDPDDDTIDEVVIEYRKVGTTTETQTASAPRELVSALVPVEKVIAEGIFAGTDYEVRATINTTPARTTTWTSWVSVTSNGDYVVQIAAAANAAAGELAATIADLGGVRSDYLSDLYAYSDSLIDGFFELQEQVVQIDDQGVKISDNVRRMELIEASAGTQLSRIFDIEEAIADIDGSQATVLRGVDVSGNSGSALASMLMRATQNPVSGVSARLALEVRANDGSGSVESGLLLDSLAGGTSRIGFKADQTVFFNTSGTAIAMFASGGSFINNAAIANLTATNITSRSLTADRIQLGSLSVAEMIAEAVTKIGFAQSGTLVNIGGGPGSAISLSFSLNPNGGDVLLDFSCFVEGNQVSGRILEITATLKRDSTVLQTFKMIPAELVPAAGTSEYRGNFSGQWVDQSRPTTSQTYTLEINRTDIYAANIGVVRRTWRGLVRKDV